jgi:phospholipase A-2-activating protein
MEGANGAMRSMQLCWNEGDDIVTAAKEFVRRNGLSEDSYEEVKNFMIDASTKEGAAIRARKAAAKGATSGTWTRFPSKGYIDLPTVDWKKVWPKFLEVNGGASAELALNEAELASVKLVVDVLDQTAKYHASTIPRHGLAPLLSKALKWPLGSVFPALDILRVTVLHPDGAQGLLEAGFAAAAQPILDIIKAGKGVAEARPALLLAARILFNSFRHDAGRKLLLTGARAADVCDAVGDLLSYEHDTVRFAAAVFLHNFAHYLNLTSLDAERAGKPSDVDPERVQQCLALLLEAFPLVKEDSGVCNLMVAFGTVLTLGPSFREVARSLDMETVVKAAPLGATSKPVAEEALKLLAMK